MHDLHEQRATLRSKVRGMEAQSRSSLVTEESRRAIKVKASRHVKLKEEIIKDKLLQQDILRLKATKKKVMQQLFLTQACEAQTLDSFKRLGLE